MKRVLFAIFATLLLSVGCAPRNEYVTVEGYMLGTTFRIVAKTALAQKQVYAEAMVIDSTAKSSMSIFNTQSLISRINAGVTDSLDIHLIRNIAVAARMYRLSDGYYDITVKPLTDAYGFAKKRKIEHPNVDSLLQFVGFEKFRVVGSRIVKSDNRLQLDLNSLAKGYTVDLLADRLEALGCGDYIVEVGGEIRTSGLSPRGDVWRVGVDTPFEGNQSPGEYQQAVIELSDRALATSGNYRRYYTDSEGNKIVHTINPKTGKGVISTLLSATVVANRCVEADAMATMFMAMGTDRAVQVAESLKDKGVEVYFIIAAGEEYRVFSTLTNRE
ncbi:MAG: FAD:protein FMN transferase [Alistipes sp.]|nr:FAD:protein FMN transferase [Alistipes sp.]MBQ2418504.1 FAD:protein FMN transferase [Alistipes sp.]